eukprot:CAMPEP_0175379322 /NCGR_PEP_ID=MMETSP0095-20121207/25746_1 /TAXON_ID=311494 /ORGANISM="Alexandrium monilatum, Strain CCMP3105" /LENGTH=76 /DNA_ID=CAMNT_0016677663 /DNA_START=56 /DNA_END=286 /DNA_ORIENTATION=-
MLRSTRIPMPEASGGRGEIDSEDETWDGTIEPTAFQQVRDALEKAKLVARVEAQNKPRPATGNSKPGQPQGGGPAR